MVTGFSVQDEERYEAEVPEEADWRSRAQQRPPETSLQSRCRVERSLSLSLSLSLFEPMRLYGDGIFNHEQKMALLDQKIAMLKGPGGSQGGGEWGPSCGAAQGAEVRGAEGSSGPDHHEAAQRKRAKGAAKGGMQCMRSV